MKIVITGSHFTPAQSLIENLSNYSNMEIYYFGRRSTMEGDKTTSVESKILPNLKVKFISITAGRLQRILTIYTLPSLIKIPIGFLQSLFFVARIQPDVVVAFGGYLSVPVVMSSWLLSIPVIVHQQTLVTGLSSKICSLFADKIALAFPVEDFKKNRKAVVIGNPIRQDLFQDRGKVEDRELNEFIKHSKKGKEKILLITGGNQGSHVINEMIMKVLPDLTKKFLTIHQTGDSKYHDFERLKAHSKELGLSNRYLPVKWINASDWSRILRVVDLIISRGGINTLLEISLFKVPTLAIPLPHIYKNEQMVNAKFFINDGWLKILPQSDLNEKNLLDNLECLDKMHTKQMLKLEDTIHANAGAALALETILLGQRNIC